MTNRMSSRLHAPSVVLQPPGMTPVSSDGRSSFISPVGLPLIEPSVAGSVGFVAGVMPTDTLLVLSSSPPLLSPQPAWASNTAASARDALGR